MKATRIALVFLALALAAGQAHAQFIVKRFPCKALLWDGVAFKSIYRNRTEATRLFHFQITRNGCRPKDLVLNVGTSANLSTAVNQQVMTGKFPDGIGFDLPDDHYVVFFISGGPGSENPKGTIDFSYTVE